MKNVFLTNQVKSFNKSDTSDLKNKILSDKEIIDVLYSSLIALDEEKYSFFNGINKSGDLEYMYITKDNYIAYYTVSNLSKKDNNKNESETIQNVISIDKLTERVKIIDGILFRWDKKKKRFEKADVKKIEGCFLLRFKWYKKRFLTKLKKRLIFNVTLANIDDFNKINIIKEYLK